MYARQFFELMKLVILKKKVPLLLFVRFEILFQPGFFSKIPNFQSLFQPQVFYKGVLVYEETCMKKVGWKTNDYTFFMFHKLRKIKN